MEIFRNISLPQITVNTQVFYALKYHYNHQLNPTVWLLDFADILSLGSI